MIGGLKGHSFVSCVDRRKPSTVEKFPITMAQTRQASKAKTSIEAEEPGRVSASTIANSSRGGNKYQRIIEAAIKVIAEKGFHNSRVADIAERANVADGTVYLYFKSKEQILMTALDSAFQAFYRQAQKELKESGDAPRKLRILARLHLRELSNNRSLAVVLQTELRQSAKFLAEFSQRELKGYFNLIREIIREGQAAGTIRRDVPDKIAAACFFGALDELVTAWVLSTRDHDLEAAADPVVDLLLSGMEARA